MRTLLTRIVRLEEIVEKTQGESEESWNARYASLCGEFLSVLSDGEWHSWAEITERVQWEDKTRDGTEWWVMASISHDLMEKGLTDERNFPNLNRSFEIRLATEPGQGRAWTELRANRTHDTILTAEEAIV